jgi:YNFM family putative membrane transporter
MPRRVPRPHGDVASLRLLQVGSFTSSVDRFLFPPLIVAIAVDLSASVATVTLAATAYFQAYGVMQAVWAMVSDRLGRVRTIRLALALASGAGLLAAIAPDPWALAWARGLTGACFAAAVPGALTYVGDTVPAARRQAPMTDLMTGAALGIALATAGAGLVADHGSWRIALVVPALVAGGLVVALRRVPEPFTADDVVGVRRGALWSFGQVFRRRWALVVLALVLAEGLVLVSLLTFLPMTLQRAGWSASVAGLVTAGYGVSVLVCAQVVKRLSGWWPPQRLVAVGAAGGCAAYGALLVDRGPAGVLAACVCLGVAWASMHTTLQAWVTDVVPEARAAAVSLFATLLFTGGAIGTTVGVAFIERDRFAELFTVGACAMVVLGPSAVLARRRYSTGSGQVAG